MRIGFTGTRVGMTIEQKWTFISEMTSLMRETQDEPIEFHHGDCVGADEEAHRIIGDLAMIVKGKWVTKIFVHPPLEVKYRAYCRGDRVYPSKEYPDRDMDIVTAGQDLLIAAPASIHETIRSGTWATIRMAREVKRKTLIIRPTGLIACEGWDDGEGRGV